jgi:hypothetical protein
MHALHAERQDIHGPLLQSDRRKLHNPAETTLGSLPLSWTESSDGVEMIYDLGCSTHITARLVKYQVFADMESLAAVRGSLPHIIGWDKAPVQQAAFDNAHPGVCRALARQGAALVMGPGFGTGSAILDYHGPVASQECAPRTAREINEAWKWLESKCMRFVKTGRRFDTRYDSYLELDESDEESGEERDDDDDGYDFCAAFPATAALLLTMRRDTGNGYWLYWRAGILRVYRGAWRGPRGVLNLGVWKTAWWVCPQRHTSIHDALAALEAHARISSAPGRAVACAERKAARAEAARDKLAKKHARMAAAMAKKAGKA